MRPLPPQVDRWLRASLQYALGGLLFLTCLGKSADFLGFVRVMESYHLFPVALAPFVGLGVLLAEGILAVCLLSGRFVPMAALGSLALNTGFFLLALITLLRKIHVPNCGCFGVFLARPLTWGTLGEDALMMGASAWLFHLSSRAATRGSFDPAHGREITSPKEDSRR